MSPDRVIRRNGWPNERVVGDGPVRASGRPPARLPRRGRLPCRGRRGRSAPARNAPGATGRHRPGSPGPPPRPCGPPVRGSEIPRTVRSRAGYEGQPSGGDPCPPGACGPPPRPCGPRSSCDPLCHRAGEDRLRGREPGRRGSARLLPRRVRTASTSYRARQAGRRAGRRAVGQAGSWAGRRNGTAARAVPVPGRRHRLHRTPGGPAFIPSRRAAPAPAAWRATRSSPRPPARRG